ncbi:hypothetical protein B9G39_02280 [Zooshikella ganghwensis]|uniref:Uncharacterized protein n=1 Tax=Zooshikella ganghwensis TaxID=202772 RepID=A0A4V1IN36_9GAMM|nr:hypothetical protein B9G39_02280 [Zooshikella ganghwensis]
MQFNLVGTTLIKNIKQINLIIFNTNHKTHLKSWTFYRCLIIDIQQFVLFVKFKERCLNSQKRIII